MIDLGNLNPETKFDYLDEGEWVSLRICPLEIVRKIIKECTTKTDREYKVIDGSPYIFKEDKTDDTLYSEKIWEYCIVNWLIHDAQGNEIPCNTEMKKLLMNGSLRFATFIKDKLELLRKVMDNDKKEELKNS